MKLLDKDDGVVNLGVFISIIIPCKTINAYVLECIDYCKKLEYGDREIIVLPDVTSTISNDVRIISTGSVTPGEKRNIGIMNATGELCAFIDSDAFPEYLWLSNALKYFKDSVVGAIGGPGITPVSDSYMQRAGGHVLSSVLMGTLSSRHKSSNISYVNEIPSCNFIARKEILIDIGLWSTKYWPGEDTLLCKKIILNGYKLIYAPDVIVYHHRRPLFREHLIQISNYAIHRSFFIRRFHNDHINYIYFIPSVFLFFVVLGGFLCYGGILCNYIYLLYFGYLFFSTLILFVEMKLSIMIPIVLLGVIVTHFVYGMYFIVGLTKGDLVR